MTREYPAEAKTRDELARVHRKAAAAASFVTCGPICRTSSCASSIARWPPPLRAIPDAWRAGVRARPLSRPVEAPAPDGASRGRPLALAAAGIGVVALGAWLVNEGPRSGVRLPSTLAPYGVDAAFYRVSDTGEQRLAEGQRLGLGDRLSFKLQTSVPAFLYIVNEPDEGQPFLLFPLPGQARQNPLPAGTQARVPESFDWQVTTAGAANTSWCSSARSGSKRSRTRSPACPARKPASP